jgi:hypothetical protein
MREATDWYDPDYLNWSDVIETREKAMRVSDRALRCVVFLGIEKGGVFVPQGTGFLVRLDHEGIAFQYLVTASHVVVGSQRVFLRINRKEGEPKVLSVPRQWYYHPDPSRYVDVAVTPIVLDTQLFDIAHIHVQNFCDDKWIKDRDIGVGDELFYPGMFVHHLGVGRNLPVMRFGALSAMPIEPVRFKAGPAIKVYLMEGRSIGGHSGSPVFINMFAPRTYYYERIVHLPVEPQNYRFLGLLRSYLKAKDTGEYITDDPKTEDLWVNTGISTIVPAQDILETLNQQDLQEQRMTDIKKLRDNLPDVPAKVPSSESRVSSADDANPNHLEDFTRLVDVAARKRPQGDQT